MRFELWYNEYMKKYYIVIGITGAVFLVASFMYFSFGGASRGIQKVISNDGLAELTIPRNALPEGMSIKDILITNVSVDDAIIAYELKPDGTAFSAPLTFKTTFKNKDSVIPVPFLISEANGIEPVSGVETTLDLTKNETTISMPIAHFSVLAIPFAAAYTLFDATVEVPAQVYIEDVVTAKATLRLNTGTLRAFDPWIGVTTGLRLVRDSVKVEGKVIGDRNNLVPYRDFDNRPPLSAFTGETLTVESSDYRCAKLGIGVIGFQFVLTYDGEAFDVVSGDVLSSGQPEALGVRKSESGGGRVSVYKELVCVARPSTGDGTGSGVSESESKAIGEILDEDRIPPSSAPPGKGIVCGLPGGPVCPPKK